MLDDVIMVIFLVAPAILVRVGSGDHPPAWIRPWAEHLLKPPAQWPWMRWLKAVPAVEEAQRQASVSYRVRQLPCIAVLLLLHAAAEWFAFPVFKGWVITVAMVMLLWPLPRLRVAFAAWRAAVAPAEPFARRLRWYAASIFLWSALMCAALVYLSGVFLFLFFFPDPVAASC